MADGKYKCHDCHMTFDSTQLLQKHKKKFCVGGNIGDPDNLLLRRGLWSAGTPSPPPQSPDVRKVEKKVVELKNYKEKQNKMRDLRQLEERILLDTLEETDRKLGRSPRRPSRARSHLHLSNDREVRQLQLEYENLKENLTAGRQQRLVMERAEGRPHKGYQYGVQPSNRRSRQDYRQDNQSVMSDASMSIHLDDDRRKKEYQKYNPNQDSQLRQLAENHGRQMEYLQIKNRDLEKQREDIRRRLEELGKKGSKPQPSDNTSQLLSELRAQEERNKLALEDLRRQLYDIHGQRVNFIEVEKSGQPQPPPAPDRKSYVYPVYYGNSLVAEISAMRQAYLQNGGNDPDVLAQMAQMQAEAQNIEDGLKQVPDKKEKKDHHGQLQMLEMENERLHKELMLLQEQNFLNRKKSDREGRQYSKDANPRVSFDPPLQAPVHTMDPHDRLDRFEAKYGRLVQQLSKNVEKDSVRGSQKSVYSLPQGENQTSAHPLKQNDSLFPQILEQGQGSLYNNGVSQDQIRSEPHKKSDTSGYQRELDLLDLELAELQMKQMKSKTSDKTNKPVVPRLDLREITEEIQDEKPESFAAYLKAEKQKEEEYKAMPFLDSDDDEQSKEKPHRHRHSNSQPHLHYSNLADNYYQPNWGRKESQSQYLKYHQDFSKAGPSRTDFIPRNLYYNGPAPPAPKSDIVDMYKQLGRPIVFRNNYSDKGVALGQPYRV